MVSALKNNNERKNMKKIILIGLVTLALSGTALMAMNPGNPNPSQNTNCNPPENTSACSNCSYNYLCATQSYCLTAPSPWQCASLAASTYATCMATNC